MAEPNPGAPGNPLGMSDMPPSVESINTLMTAIKPALGLSEVIKHEDGVAWTLGVEEKLAMLAEYSVADGRLTLSAETARPDRSRRAETYEFLMLFNAQWRETGGIRMVLEAPDAPVVQVAEIELDTLDRTAFAAIVGGFAAKALAWRRLIADGAGLDRGEAGQETEEVLCSAPGAFRV